MSLTLSPRGVPFLTAARKRSPVEMCGSPSFSTARSAMVPLPAPGGPKKISFMLESPCLTITHGRGLVNTSDLVLGPSRGAGSAGPRDIQLASDQDRYMP